MKTTTRAERRHAHRREKARVAAFLRRQDVTLTPRRVGRRANAQKGCSCGFCDNPRRVFGALTRQETLARCSEAHE